MELKLREFCKISKSQLSSLFERGRFTRWYLVPVWLATTLMLKVCRLTLIGVFGQMSLSSSYYKSMCYYHRPHHTTFHQARYPSYFSTLWEQRGIIRHVTANRSNKYTLIWFQTWTVTAVLFNMCGQGMLLGFTTALLPALRDPDSPIKADLNTASWLSSSVGLSGVIGFLFASFLMDVYGRKTAHFIITIPAIIGWTLIYFSVNVSTLMAGRVLGGITAGAGASLGAISIGEYSSPSNRGMFLNLKTAAVCSGGLSAHILGNFFTWRTIAMCATIPHIVAVLITLTWPESPSWLAGKQQFERCEKSFYWLRGKDDNTFKELEDLIGAQTNRLRNQPKSLTFTDKMMDFFRKFTRKDFLKPFFIILIATILLEMSGRHIFPAYALQIVEEITGSKGQSFYLTLSIDLIILTSALFSSILVRIMKRRTLLFASGFSAFAILMLVCTYIFLATKDVVSKENKIPSALFALYFILVNLGCTPIPLAVLGELYPLAHRGVGSAMSGVIMSLGVMMGLQVTPFLFASIKVYGTFAVFGIIMGISLLILYFTLPETKDRTLQEIEDYFNYGSFKKRNDKDEDETVKIVL